MTPKTTEAATRQGDGLLTTSRGNGSQQFRPSSKEQNMNNSTPRPFRPAEGQKVRILRGGHAGKLGTVKEIDGGNVWVLPDGAATVAPYTPEELAPVRTDDTVPATDAEVVKHLTGTVPTVAVKPTVDLYECPEPGCGWVLGAVGPVADGEPDEWADDVETHRRSHQPDTVTDVGMWKSQAGDVIVFRTTDGVVHADVLADARVDDPAALRELGGILLAAAKAWEVAL